MRLTCFYTKDESTLLYFHNYHIFSVLLVCGDVDLPKTDCTDKGLNKA